MIQKRQQEEQRMLYNERRRVSAEATGSNVPFIDDPNAMNMKDYIVSRKDGLQKWESREAQLIEQL